MQLQTDSNQKQSKTKQSKPRLKSLDALRGFDMFWIIGGEGLFLALFTLTGWAGWQVAHGQMLHSEWHGFTFYDLIFPLFIFLSGVAIGLSPKRLTQLPKEVKAPIYRHASKRLVLLILLGILYNHGWGTGVPADVDEIRFSSVLARIGFAWFFAVMLVWHTSLKTQVFVTISILIVYSLVQLLAPLPNGFDPQQLGRFSMEASVNTYIDSLLRPGIAYQHRPLDPEGVLSTIPAVVNALIGVFAGMYLGRNKQRAHDAHYQWQTVLGMSLAGGALWGLGWLLNPLIPVNKDLWTASFVLITSGWSLLFFALFYAVIDVIKWQRWAGIFTVIGTNSIIIYLASSVMNWQYINLSLFGGVIQSFNEAWQPLVTVIGLLSAQCLVLAWMHKKQIFIRI